MVCFRDIVLLAADSGVHRRVQALWDARGEPWFYLRLGRDATGLRLIRVLREGLWSDVDLGETSAGPTPCVRLPPAPGPDLLEPGAGNALAWGLRDVGR